MIGSKDQFEGLAQFDKHKPRRPSDIMEVWCPFCLVKKDLRLFEKTLKSGKTSNEMICPECKVVFYRSSLVTEETGLDKYVNWVVGYSSMGFFQKINWNVWSDRLKQMGIITEFWEKYRQLKPKKEEGSQLDKEWD